MTWNERKFVNDVLAQNVKDVLAQNVNDVMLDRACAPYGIAMGHWVLYCTHKCGHSLRVAPAHKIGQATI